MLGERVTYKPDLDLSVQVPRFRTSTKRSPGSINTLAYSEFTLSMMSRQRIMPSLNECTSLARRVCFGRERI